MIEIKITDPHLMDKTALRKTVTYLLGMAGDHIIPVPVNIPTPSPQVGTPISSFVPTVPLIQSPPAALEQLDSPPIAHINPFAKTVEQSAPVVPHANHSIPVAPKPLDPSIELDRRGFPWDNRIHSRTKSKTSDGLWKSMRGVNPEMVRSVEAELMQAMSAPVISPSIPPAPANYTPPEMQAPFSPPPMAITDPILPPQNDFPALMHKITAAVNSGKIKSASVLKIVQDFGLPSLPVVATRPDLIPAIIANLDAMIGAA